MTNTVYAYYLKTINTDISLTEQNQKISHLQKDCQERDSILYCWGCKNGINTRTLDPIQEGWEYDEKEDIYTCSNCKED